MQELLQGMQEQQDRAAPHVALPTQSTGRLAASVATKRPGHSPAAVLVLHSCCTAALHKAADRQKGMGTLNNRTS